MKKIFIIYIIITGALILLSSPVMASSEAPDTTNLLDHPEDIVFDQSRNCCYITNNLGDNVLKRDSAGGLEIIYDTINSPMGIALSGDTLIISSTSPAKLTVLNAVSYEKIHEIILQDAQYLAQIDIDPRTHLAYIVDQKGQIIKFNYRTGTYNIFVPTGAGIAYGSQSPEVDTLHNRLLVFKWPAGYIRTVDLSDSSHITNAAPQGTSEITASFSGPDNEIYVSSWLNGCVYRYNADLSGGPEEIANDQCDPAGLTLDPVTNILYVCNYTCNTIEIIHLTPAGNPDPGKTYAGYSLFPNPASEIASIDFKMNKPGNVSVLICDLTGNELFNSIYQLETGNHRIGIPVSSLRAGVYLVSLKSNDLCISTKKLVIP